jgi:hypothetical protein
MSRWLWALTTGVVIAIGLVLASSQRRSHPAFREMQAELQSRTLPAHGRVLHATEPVRYGNVGLTATWAIRPGMEWRAYEAWLRGELTEPNWRLTAQQNKLSFAESAPGEIRLLELVPTGDGTAPPLEGTWTLTVVPD